MISKTLPKSVAFLTGTALLSATPSLAIQCSDTESLLKVSYKIDEPAFTKLHRKAHNDDDLRKLPELVLRPSGNVGSSTSKSSVSYDSFEDVKDFETCIPMEGACLELTVSTFPTNLYSIMWNGKVVNVGREFTKDGGHPITTTELGDFCTPTCDTETEALFDYEYWTSSTGSVYGYRVEDASSGNKVLECSNPHGTCGSLRFHSMYRYRACLPKDACYTFITAHGKQWIHGNQPSENSPILSYKYNGQVGDTDGFISSPTRFISSSFGSSKCKPECNPDSESRVEFIMLRDRDIWCNRSPLRTDLEYRWKLTEKEGDGDDEPSSAMDVSSGVVPHCPDTPWHRAVMCLPKKSCASFHIESKEHILTDSVSSYSLTMDGISYKSSKSINGWNETTTDIGSDCKTVVDDAVVPESKKSLRGSAFAGDERLRRVARS